MANDPKVMSGARAKVGFVDQNGANYTGIYNNFSYNVTLDIAPVFILGRFSVAGLEYTAVEPVSCSGNAYRVLRHGAHVDGRVPRLKDLLTFRDLTIVVVDRANVKIPIATIHQVKPGGYNTSLSARQLEEMSMPYMGVLVDDEDGNNTEPADSLELPQ